MSPVAAPEPRASALPSKAETLDRLRKALSSATAEHVEASLHASSEGSTRFSNNTITQNLADEDCTVSVRAAFGRKVGQAQTNDLSDEGIARAVARAESIAKSAAEDLEYLPPLPPQAYRARENFDEATASASPEARADWVVKAVKAAGKGVTLSGSTATHGWAQAFLNSKGAEAYARGSSARFTATAIAPDSTGWAEGQSRRASELDPAALADRAADKARRGAAPKPLEPGTYAVVLEPAAVAEYLSFLVWSLGAKPADEGRSCLSGKLGTQVAGPNVTLSSDPAAPGCETAPFGEDGLPAPAETWIDKGACARLVTSRFWGQKTGKPVTGTPSNFLMAGGTTPLEEMIRSTERGVLVTRFWYIRFVDPMSLLLTGMTRDGLFWIQDGKVAHGLTNMRFNDSPFRSLKQVEALGAPELSGEYMPASVPPVKLSGFTFSSRTTF